MWKTSCFFKKTLLRCKINVSLFSLLLDIFFFQVQLSSINYSKPILTLLFLVLSAEKPLPQGPPGGVIGILGGVVAIGLIVGVAVTVFMVHRRQQKTRTETDNDLWVLSLCQRILQGAGQVVRLGVHSCQPMREKHFEKDKTRFFGRVNVFKERRTHWEHVAASLSIILRAN